MSITIDEVKKLSIHERIELVEQIWDSIAAHPEQIELTEAQRAELDRRLEAMQANPDEGVPWEELRQRLARKK